MRNDKGGFLMRKILGMAVLLVTACIGASPTEASITLSAGTANNFGSGVTAGLTGPNGTVAPITFGANSIGIDLTFLKAGAPISLSFNVDSNVVDPIETQVFLVTVKTTNGISPFNTGLGFAMNGFDVVAIDSDPPNDPFVSLNGLTQPGSVAGTGGSFAVLPFASNPIKNTNQGGYRFGGWNGGGGEIYNGQYNTNTFGVRVSALNGTSSVANAFNLVFTANPEPTTLLLGSIIMGPAAYALRRRRKLQAAESIEAV